MKFIPGRQTYLCGKKRNLCRRFNWMKNSCCGCDVMTCVWWWKDAPDLDQTAQLILSHPPGGGARDVTGDLHLLHGLDVITEVGARGGLSWADVYDHQPLHQTRLHTETDWGDKKKNRKQFDVKWGKPRTNRKQNVDQRIIKSRQDGKVRWHSARVTVASW